MRRYVQLFQNDVYSADLLEAVFIPKKEVIAILELLNKNKSIIFKQKLQDYELCKYLSSILKSYKILFTYEKLEDDEENNFFLKGSYNHISDIISIPCLSKINYISEDNYFNLFLKTFQLLIGHELVHRMEYIQRALEKLSNKIGKDKDPKKYLSDPDEIMAYAWQTVEELRYRFGDDQEILNLIKSDSPIKYRVSYALTIYKTNFSLDEKLLKLFYKYVYMYLDSKEAKR